MGRILMILMTIAGLNLNNVPGQIGDNLMVMGDGAQYVSKAVGNVASNLNLKGVSNIKTASIGGLSTGNTVYVKPAGFASLTTKRPVNVATANTMRARSSKMSAFGKMGRF